LARERGDEVSRSVDLKIIEAMAQVAKEDKIKKAIEEELRKKVSESQVKKKDKKSKEKEIAVTESDEELSDDGEFFLRDRPA
jgi:hypothetical protein